MRAFERITFDPKIMQGMACIRGMRITVSLVLSLADGLTHEEVIRQYPDLEEEDIKESLRYASWLTREEQVIAD